MNKIQLIVVFKSILLKSSGDAACGRQAIPHEVFFGACILGTDNWFSLFLYVHTHTHNLGSD
jgi:hypothetical protein